MRNKHGFINLDFRNYFLWRRDVFLDAMVGIDDIGIARCLRSRNPRLVPRHRLEKTLAMAKIDEQLKISIRSNAAAWRKLHTTLLALQKEYAGVDKAANNFGIALRALRLNVEQTAREKEAQRKRAHLDANPRLSVRAYAIVASALILLTLLIGVAQ